MNTNFDKLFLQEKSKIATSKPTLLLHVCCAPCATYCLTQVLDAFDVTLYYANDNITKYEEWQKRLDEVQRLVDIVNKGQFDVQPAHPLKLVVRPFDSQRFFAVAKGLEWQKEGGLRCGQCFLLRLTDTMEHAIANNFDYFATTLTVSPHKNHVEVNQIGMHLQALAQQQQSNLLWLPTDFKKRNGYNQSVQLSAKYNIYRQNYCGCCYSIVELR